MSQNLHGELKKEFQLERMILFSDAVFAIAITLLAIEIKVPEIDKRLVTDQLLVDKLGELIPKFIGFFISFFIIGLYWIIHHRTFGYVVNYNRRLLWLNLFFLLAVVLMPFSTGFYSTYVVSFLKTPIIVYVLNIVFLGVMNLLLWRHINNPKHGLAEGIAPDERRYYSFRAITVPVVFVLVALVYLFVDPKVAAFLPMLIPVGMRLLKHFYFKKHNLNPKQKF